MSEKQRISAAIERSSDILANLREARAMVARAWIQGFDRQIDMGTGRPCAWCARGAILDASPNNMVATSAHHAVRSALPPGVWSLVEWNDARSRTQAEVLALFDRAIAAEVARADAK